MPIHIEINPNITPVKALQLLAGVFVADKSATCVKTIEKHAETKLHPLKDIDKISFDLFAFTNLYIEKPSSVKEKVAIAIDVIKPYSFVSETKNNLAI